MMVLSLISLYNNIDFIHTWVGIIAVMDEYFEVQAYHRCLLCIQVEESILPFIERRILARVLNAKFIGDIKVGVCVCVCVCVTIFYGIHRRLNFCASRLLAPRTTPSHAHMLQAFLAPMAATVGLLVQEWFEVMIPLKRYLEAEAYQETTYDICDRSFMSQTNCSFKSWSLCCLNQLNSPRLITMTFLPFMSFVIWFAGGFRRLSGLVGKWKIPRASGVVRDQVNRAIL